MSRSSRFWLLAILCVATLLRFGGVGKRELWFDERITAGVVTGAALTDPIRNGSTFTAADFWSGATPQAVLDASIRADAGNGVLYSLLLHGWMRLAGASAGTLRVPSALFGVLAVGLLYLVARRRLSETGALLAAGVAAVHPFLVRYSQEARSYSLATFLGLAATYFFLRIVEKDPERPLRHAWVGYGFAAGAAMLSHYLSVYVLLAHAGWAVLFLRDRGRWTRYLMAAVLAGLVALPWLLTGGREGTGLMRSLDEAYRQRAVQVAPGEEWALPVTPRNVAAGWAQMGLALGGNRLQTAGLRLTVLLPLLGVALLAAAAGWRLLAAADRGTAWLILLLAVAAPAFALLLAVRSGHMISFSAQYACFGVPYAALLLGVGLEGLLQRHEKRGQVAWRRLLLAVLGLTWLGSLQTVVRDLPGQRPPDPYAVVVGRLSEQIRPGDRVVYPSWAVARLCNLHLKRDVPWEQGVNPNLEWVELQESGGRMRYGWRVPAH